VILNLMPCVFPILSMKALALASHADAASRPRLQGLAFLGGVLVTFVALAALLIAAKAAGAAVGWGFQLQSPGVVAALALVMLLIGLNLSGVFEAGLSLQAAAGSASHGGMVGSALTGALAVVVAAPCTAPFMAGAIAWALTQSEPAALAVFAALGLGFAAPFTLLSFAPALLRRLPRPGPWMEALKKALAFPMYGAGAWLVWVATLQAGTTALAALLAAAVVLALAAWLYGAAQRAQARGSRPALIYAAAGLFALLAAGAAAAGLRAPAAAQAAASTTAGAGSAIPEEPFSAARLDDLRAQGKPVFVNFTAAWCITCQVNERAALSSPEVAQAFARTGAVYLKADWTRRDPEIARALAAQGRAGVPLYLVYGSGGGAPQVLPQLLSQGTVISAIEKAASPGA
jgi:thiol:disulfide interchange protein DsbD